VTGRPGPILHYVPAGRLGQVGSSSLGLSASGIVNGAWWDVRSRSRRPTHDPSGCVDGQTDIVVENLELPGTLRVPATDGRR
jgi:hypothetical protein